MMDAEIVTDPRYWDCNCEHRYIHLKRESVECDKCGAQLLDENGDDSGDWPDSRIDEIAKAELHAGRPVDIWADVLEHIPYLQLPPDCVVQIVPPDSDSVARLKLKKGEREVEVRLDYSDPVRRVQSLYYELYPTVTGVRARYEASCEVLDLERAIRYSLDGFNPYDGSGG